MTETPTMQDLIYIEICEDNIEPADSLVLPFADRQKARQRVHMCSGRTAGLKLPRGTVLRGDDKIRSEDGSVALIIAAAEDVSRVRASDQIALARAAYHLGNRHVWLEVGDGWLRYLADHVLDDMVRNLGVAVDTQRAPFEPEAGAYSHRSSHTATNGHVHDPDH